MSSSSSSALPRLIPGTSIVLQPEPLTPSAFAPFGTAISCPLPGDLVSVPPDEGSEDVGFGGRTVRANQNTALKTSPVSALTDNYRHSSSSSSSKGLMSIFSCFPRRNTYVDPDTKKLRLAVGLLERHPFTTQTFCPFNFSSSSSTESNDDDDDDGVTYFLVIVAPMNVTGNDNQSVHNPPDLTRARAFICPVAIDGGKGLAVTYAPGTWHAPMVVLGRRRVDFLVTQFVNGVPEDDCQEVLVGDTENKSKRVEVDLAGLGLEAEGLWRPTKKRKSKVNLKRKAKL